MAAVPAGQRAWKCPDCGSEVLLPITKLDPLACDVCLAKLKGASRTDGSSGAVTQIASSGLVRLIAVGAGMLITGLLIGFIAGRWSVPAPAVVRPTRPDDDPTSRPVPVQTKETHPSSNADSEEPDESTRPGPGYKWVHGYTRKDGVKVKGHWAKDSKR